MKYNIEGNIDFFSELYKSLDEEENQNKTESDNTLCLITNKPLIDKSVELICGHKFNYIPLYNDIYNHKKKFNNMEGPVSSLKMNEIRCPYCRKKQEGVLPYYSDLMSEKINGVNFYDNSLVLNKGTIQPKPIYFFGKCEFILLQPKIQEENKVCSVTYVTTLECDNKSYCWSHLRIMSKRIEKEKQNKIKETEKKIKEETKQKEKEDKKKVKETEKLAKKTKKKPNDLILSIIDTESENIVVNSSIQSEMPTINEGCVQIIKSGENKGNPCGLQILNDCLCKRHYNLKNKSNNIKII
jgi:hypothetical protein